VIRRARPQDLEAIVRILRESRAEAMPWLPVLHTAEDDLDHFRGRLDSDEVILRVPRRPVPVRDRRREQRGTDAGCALRVAV
jgi:hypothetical protein